MKALFTILFFACVIRIVLVPISAGWDFQLFEQASILTLEGKNIYSRDVQLRDLPDPYTGHVPLAYPPLYLYILTPLKYISMQVSLLSDFRFLGKLPAIISDILIGYVIYALLVKTRNKKTALFAMSLFVLNPLVIYNSALYGRFDSVALLIILAAIINVKSTSSPIFYGLAVSLKTLPLFILPGLVIAWAGERIKKTILALSIPTLLSLPYVLWEPVGFLFSVFFLHATKPALGLTWQRWIYDFNEFTEDWTDLAMARNELPLFVSTALFVFFLILSIALARYLLKEPHTREKLIFYCGAVFVLFPVFNKVVFEQYLVWALPFLLLMFFGGRIRLALLLYGLFTISGIMSNEFVLAWYRFRPAWSALLSGVILVSLWWMIREESKKSILSRLHL